MATSYFIRGLAIMAVIALPTGLLAQQPPLKTPPMPAKTAPVLAKAAPATADETHNILIESVGLFGGLQLYNTYLNIGLLADAMSLELYESGDVYQLLGSVILPVERVEIQLDKLKKIKLSDDDQKALAQMKKIASLLKTQGKELEAYWENGFSENAEKYEASRKAAYKELNDLLELEPKEEVLPAPREKANVKP